MEAIESHGDNDTTCIMGCDFMKTFYEWHQDLVVYNTPCQR